MPWVKRVKPEHECRLPALYTGLIFEVWDTRKAVAGSRWRCRRCKQTWEVSWSAIGGYKWVRVWEGEPSE